MKNHLKKLFLLFGVGILAAPPSMAFTLGTAKEDAGQAGAFLDYSASARALAMGRAQVAVADDASSTYWNPAGLAHLRRGNIVAVYSMFQENSAFGFLSFGQPIYRIGTIGLALGNLSSGDFEKRNGLGEKIGSANMSESGLIVSHALNFKRKYALGISFKIVRQQVDSYSDTGYGIDMGLQGKWATHWGWGLNLKNLIAPSIQLKNSRETYPRDVRMGLKYNPIAKWLLTADVGKTENRDAKLLFGTEFILMKMAALRVGMNDTEMTMGFGINADNWGLDYALGYNNSVPGGDNWGASHRMGFHISFGKNIQEIASEKISLHWQKRAQSILADLRRSMENNVDPSPFEIEKLLEDATSAIRYRGFPNPMDLYEAEGYLSYFQNNYGRCVYYLGEALALGSGEQPDLKNRYRKAMARLNEEQKRTTIRSNLKSAKEYYEKNEFKQAIATCEKILLLDPENLEAAALLEDAKKRDVEPILRAMKIAKAEMERKSYLDAIQHLSQVRALDPENKEAILLINKAIESLEQTQREIQSGRYIEELHLDLVKSRQFYSEGLQLYSKGDIKAAMASWERAIQYDVNNSAARNAYNRALLEIKDSQ